MMHLDTHTFSKAFALFCARQVLGLIFFMAGLWKVFSLGPAEHARRLFLPFAETSFLPEWMLWAAGTVVPFAELIGGGLLMLGSRIREALVMLGLVLILVTFGHLLDQPLYELHIHVLPRLGLLLFIMMVDPRNDCFSLDHWIRHRNPLA